MFRSFSQVAIFAWVAMATGRAWRLWDRQAFGHILTVHSTSAAG